MLRFVFGLQIALVVAGSQFGFLSAKDSNGEAYRYLVSIASFSSSVPSQPRSSLLTLEVLRDEQGAMSEGCSTYPNDYWGKAVMVSRGNCSFAQKAEFASSSNAELLVVVNTEDNVFVMSGSLTTTLQVVMMSKSNGEHLARLDSASIAVYSPSRRIVSMTALWLMAVFTVLAGSLWASPSTEVRAKPQASHDRGDHSPEQEEEQVLEVSMQAAVCFVVFASIALVTLYLFMKSLILFIIIAFAIGAASASHACVYVFLVHHISSLRSSGLMSTVQVYLIGQCTILSILVAVFSCTVSVVFVVFRHESYSWIFQDFMGISMCLLFFKTFRFPNMKIAACLLILAFGYDIFWVFLSPYIFSKSVMVEVATGGGTSESIPMLLRFPEFCEGCSDGLLGLGDIVLPGLFVSFTLTFDRVNGLSLTRGYFLYNMIGYGVGLLITYAALIAMQKGQPALLYLVPCTLGVTTLVAASRGQLNQIWNNSQPETEHLSDSQSEWP